MTKLATMGTSSCATISIGGFKGESAHKLNEEFRESGNFDTPENCVQFFYDDILFPTEQELGHTDEYPFDALMDAIDNSRMEDKFIIATLNQYQMNYRDGYWPTRLAARGFVMFDATKNNIGQSCFIFSRNLARVPLDSFNEEEEEDDYDDDDC